MLLWLTPVIFFSFLIWHKMVLYPDFLARTTNKYDAASSTRSFQDDSKRSHFEQDFNWRIDQDADEFVIKIKRKPEAARYGCTNVAVRLEGGLTDQADGSVKFDGGAGSGSDGNGVSTFGIFFKISHEEPTTGGAKTGEEIAKLEEGELEWDASQHLNMTPQQYLAHQTLVMQQQAQLQAMQLQTARRSAAMLVSSGRALCTLVGPRTCYKNCWPGSCTC